MSKLPIKRDNSDMVLIMKKTSNLFKTLLFCIYWVKILTESNIKNLVRHLFLVVLSRIRYRVSLKNNITITLLAPQNISHRPIKIANGIKISKTISKYADNQKKLLFIDVKAMHILYYTSGKTEFDIIILNKNA